MIIKYPKYGGINLSKLKIPLIAASTVMVAIFVIVAGLSIGEEAAPADGDPGTLKTGIPILSDVEPQGDNEHFGITNVGTAAVDLSDYNVAIDDAPSVPLTEYNLKPGEEVNVLFSSGVSANEPGETDLYLTAAAPLTLNDNAGRITLNDRTGTLKSELTYNHKRLK
jgi:hypothetical protein